MFLFNKLNSILSFCLKKSLSVHVLCFQLMLPLTLNAMELTANDIANAIKPGGLPINAWLIQKVTYDLELAGIKTSINGIQISQSFHDADVDCDYGHFDSDISLSLNLNNGTHLLPNLTLDSSISYFNAFIVLDALTNVVGGFNAHPMIHNSLFNSCNEAVPAVHRDINTPQTLSALAKFDFYLNPKYISSSQSTSKKPEIALSPSGNINTNIGNYDSTLRPEVENSYNQILTSVLSAADIFNKINKINQLFLLYKGEKLATVVASCVTEPITCIIVTAVSILVKWWNDISNHIMSDSISYIINGVINPHVTAFFNQFIGSGYNIDITNKITTYNKIILPSEAEIFSSILPKLLVANNVCPVVGIDASRDPGKALYDFLVGDKVNIDKHLQQSRQACNAVISTITNLVLSDDDLIGKHAANFGLAGLSPLGNIYYTSNLSTWNNVPGFLSQLITGDLNGDGKADIAGLSSTGQIYYTTNLSTWNNIPGFINQLVVDDLNGDGHADIAGLSSTGQIYYTTNLSTWNNVPGFLSQLVTGDLNGDGKADIAGLSSTGRIYYTTNFSTWNIVSGTLGKLMTSDLNGDGHADIVGLSSTGQIYYTTNLSTWNNVPGFLSNIVVGDVNGDGLADIAGLSSTGQIYYTTNLSTWTNVPGFLSNIVVGDVNGDGKADIAGLSSTGQIYYTTNLTTWNNVPGFLSQLVSKK